MSDKNIIMTEMTSTQIGTNPPSTNVYEQQITKEQWDKVKNSQPKVDGGGLRHNTGKLRMDLVPTTAMRALARVMGYGAKKYAPFNWARGMQYSIVIGCLLRHLTAWMDGEDNDPESGLSHLDHVIANVAFLIHYAEHYKAGDDRFKLPPKEIE